MYFTIVSSSDIVKPSKGNTNFQIKKGGQSYVKEIRNVPGRVLQDMRTQITKKEKSEND